MLELVNKKKPRRMNIFQHEVLLNPSVLTHENATITRIKGSTPHGIGDIVNVRVTQTAGIGGGNEGKHFDLSTLYSLDTNKSYRFTVWVKLKQAVTESSSSFNIYPKWLPETDAPIVKTSGGLSANNRALLKQNVNTITAGLWRLYSTYIYKAGTTTFPYLNRIISTEYEEYTPTERENMLFANPNLKVNHGFRFFALGRLPVGTEFELYDFRLEEIDGNEPSIAQMLTAKYP